MIKYLCPHCDAELKGELGHRVYCGHCNITYETSWDYHTQEFDDEPDAWLTGREWEGRVLTDKDDSKKKSTT